MKTIQNRTHLSMDLAEFDVEPYLEDTDTIVEPIEVEEVDERSWDDRLASWLMWFFIGCLLPFLGLLGWFFHELFSDFDSSKIDPDAILLFGVLGLICVVVFLNFALLVLFWSGVFRSLSR